MTNDRYIRAELFTDRVFGGNPLAVLPDAAGPTAAQMAKPVKELNLSESTFVRLP